MSAERTTSGQVVIPKKGIVYRYHIDKNGKVTRTIFAHFSVIITRIPKLDVSVRWRGHSKFPDFIPIKLNSTPLVITGVNSYLTLQEKLFKELRMDIVYDEEWRLIRYKLKNGRFVTYGREEKVYQSGANFPT